MSNHWWDILASLVKASNRIMLIGPPGTGKSRTAIDVLGNGVERLTMTEGTGVEDLLGMFHLRDGETVWVDGPAASALRNGKPLVIDEIDHYSPEIGSLMYALLDDDPQCTLPNGEHLKAAAGYKVIATSNANPSSLPEAILDRMEAILLCAKPHHKAMQEMTEEERAAVAGHYEKAVVKAWQWSGSATLRRMRAFSKFRKELANVLAEAVIAEAVFGQSGKEMLSVLATAARRSPFPQSK